MNVHIDILRLHREVQQRERVFMLHHIALVPILDRFGDESAPDIAPVDKIILKIPVSPGDHRLSDKSRHLDIALLGVYGQKIGCDLPPVDRVDDVLQVVVSRGVETALVVHDEPDRDLRVGQGDLFHEIRHMSALRGLRL